MKTYTCSHAATRRLNFGLLLGVCALAPLGAQCVSAQVANDKVANDKMAAPMKINGGKLPTRWAKDVSPTNPLPEYPRPQMVRSNWVNLNGPWNYALSDQSATTAPTDYAGKILVPFPYEAALSGEARESIPTQKLWYQRTFQAPANWKKGRVLLHFDAVNYDAQVWLNGKMIGTHQGGFDAFSFDVTDGLKTGSNELVVSAFNPIRADVPDAQVIGKQRVKPGGIFYTGATGIWQTVWLEPVPKTYIANLKMAPDIDKQTLTLQVDVQGGTAQGTIEVMDGKKSIGKVVGDLSKGALKIPIKNPQLWSPSDPHLYGLKVSLKSGDSVDSYFAMRKVSLGKDEQGRNRIFLNNKFLFQVGALDQGYWPDGIFTAPTDEALRYDIEIAKKLGWNLLRKHAKVEPARWYYHADKIGMLVWQDMPQAFGDLNDTAKAQWELEWRREIAQFYNHPSIIVWTTFNEGWGQHDTEKIVALTRELDPTRLVNNASGWVDKNVGDIHDTHAYPGPWSELPSETRASVNGEFGGITMSVPDHRWQNNVQVMGYGATLDSSWLATKRFQNLMKTAYRLRDERGMSAAVYTQLTDVEQEINGLLTYDRALIKMDEKIATAANKGEFLPLPPNPNPDLVPTSDDEPINWQYTTDKPANDDWFGVNFAAQDWKTGAAPFGNDMSNVRTSWKTPDLWIRRSFTLPQQLPEKIDLLVKHDEDTEIYINGVLAATVPDYDGDYKRVAISAAARATLKPGQNVIAAHVHQSVGGQGLDIGLAGGTK